MIERFAYRRLRNAPRIAPLITALGVSFFLENGAQLVLGAQFQSYNSFSWTNSPIALNGFTLPAQVRVSYAQIIVVVGDDRPDDRADATSSSARRPARRCARRRSTARPRR